MSDEEIARAQRRKMLDELATAWALVRDDMFTDLADADLVDLIDEFSAIVFDAVDELHKRHDPTYVPAPRPTRFRGWPPRPSDGPT